MSVVVMKAGGSVAVETAAVARAMADGGDRVCVVHGAGPQISAGMKERGIEVQFVNGLRFTSYEALQVVRDALGRVNGSLCEAIGRPALGMMGDEIGLEAEHRPELGFVGEARPSKPRPVVEALEAARIPVVTPLAMGPLNVNADQAAAALAQGIGAERLRFMVDVPGVLFDGAVLDSIDADEALRLLDAGMFQGGIVPKLLAATAAARAGLDVSIGATAILGGIG